MLKKILREVMQEVLEQEMTDSLGAAKVSVQLAGLATGPAIMNAH